MTRQVRDGIVLRGEEYRVIMASDAAGNDWQEVFSPLDHGMVCTGISTGDRRGYRCCFVVDGDRLVLRDLVVRDWSQLYPPLNGVESVPQARGYRLYEGVGLELAFTGTLLVGAKPTIDLLFSHSVSDPFFEYELPRRLSFEAGRLVGDEDLSEEARRIREERGGRSRFHRFDDYI